MKQGCLVWSYCRYNDLLQHYNIPFSQFLCDLVLCWCVLRTPDLTSPDMTGYTLNSTAGAWPHQVKFTLLGHLFTHLGFPIVRVVLSIIFVPGFIMIIMILYERMTDGYFLPYTYRCFIVNTSIRYETRMFCIVLYIIVYYFTIIIYSTGN